MGERFPLVPHCVYLSYDWAGSGISGLHHGAEQRVIGLSEEQVRGDLAVPRREDAADLGGDGGEGLG